MADFKDLLVPAAEVIARCAQLGLKVATAESCTGGLVAGALTAVPGSSAAVDRGFVAYSNEAKMELLAVPEALIREHGAVSEAVAVAMAEGALARSRADIAVAITGIAGPGGGTPEKPVGLVHFAVARRGGRTRHQVHAFEDLGRESIRLASVREALAMLMAETTLSKPLA